MSHTPGRWIIDHDKRGRSLMVFAKAGGMTGVVINEIGRTPTRVDLANARLIAAAPELLEALKECAAFIAATFIAEEHPGMADDIGELYIKAYNAIARVEGK